MSTKAFLKLLISLILIFSLTAISFFVAYVTTKGGSFFGYEFNSIDNYSHINVMLLGLDKEGTRTDVMILLQLNIVDGEINMLQIPRDTYMKDNGRSDKKINSAYGVDKEKSVFEEIYDLLDIRVDNYVVIDTNGFRDLIDTIGGVDFYVPQDMKYSDPTQDLYIDLKEGQQHLDGDKAEQLVRFRSYPMGDLQRMQVQSDFIKATIDEIFDLANVVKIDQLVEDFSKTVKTNFTLDEMLAYAPYVLSTDRSKIQTHQLVCTPYDRNGISYVVSDYEANQELILEHFTPSTAKEITSAEIRNTVIGSGKATDAGNVKAKKSKFNVFTSVNIIDASGGKADVVALDAKLEEYGYNVLSIKNAEDVRKETQLVSKGRRRPAKAISNILNLDQYINNPDIDNGADITIILGEEYGG